MHQLVAWWPTVRDRQWTQRDAFVAAAALRGALSAGYSQERAEMIAETAGYKNLFKGIVYSDQSAELRRLRLKPLNTVSLKRSTLCSGSVSVPNTDSDCALADEGI